VTDGAWRYCVNCTDSVLPEELALNLWVLRKS
jgi:hypothetical protein